MDIKSTMRQLILLMIIIFFSFCTGCNYPAEGHEYYLTFYAYGQKQEYITFPQFCYYGSLWYNNWNASAGHEEVIIKIPEHLAYTGNVLNQDTIGFDFTCYDMYFDFKGL